MAGEADQNPPIATKPTSGGNKSDSGMESDVLATSSSATVAAIKMADVTPRATTLLITFIKVLIKNQIRW
jgi:hypothetical protein